MGRQRSGRFRKSGVPGSAPQPPNCNPINRPGICETKTNLFYSTSESEALVEAPHFACSRPAEYSSTVPYDTVLKMKKPGIVYLLFKTVHANNCHYQEMPSIIETKATQVTINLSPLN